MTDTAKALYSFFSGFGIPAYVRRNIPMDAEMPYITYDLVEPEPLQRNTMNAWVWYRGGSFVDICDKCDQIKDAIGTGISLPTDNGCLYLFRSDTVPFIQMQDDPNPDVKCAFLSMLIHANT